MSKEKFYTSQEAADELGLSSSRIRQLALADQIDHRYFGKALMVTELGIRQAKERKRKPGPKPQKKQRSELA